jgi:hypothetical protein
MQAPPLDDIQRAHPNCTHCGTVSLALTIWDQHTHDVCPCACHATQTTKARLERAKPRRKKR